ncbi:EcoAI/FtnUII family type I restriction enzme subunit R [Geitlerinema sp. PCC 7407]|uniref:EcoAI/FtnUII family type I restriction enzme subunit R n=1 Tax=Geitlerinema sp. PCC 7407 TaxID=1173025 RepID=UPI00029FD0FA|nr:DEAD/DEAH box helicase family protein [Geitlerinema sp. PCC 7407]AFY67930.1 Type I site-specific deoxyribonuclease [Geitlerinema sp. PCC 7407]
MANEANTCRHYVVPKLEKAGWDGLEHTYTEQYYFTAGKLKPKSRHQLRGHKKFADYVLLYAGSFPLAIVEAKQKRKDPNDGLDQAKDYAQILGVKFAYSTNGQGIVEHDFTTGLQSDVMDSFPSPDELWQRLRKSQGLNDELIAECLSKPFDAIADKLLAPFNPNNGKEPRYYQRIAINRAVEVILRGRQRLLITMATGTGKTSVAFQICWKLSRIGWNATGEHRSPRILFLADRNVLVDDPRNKDFAAFGEDKIRKIQGSATKGRELYFATYQAIAQDTMRPGLYREYSPNYFDLIIVDECHRGSARDESNWRAILNYFQPAYQLGLTATPKREDNVDTYAYFGNPIYTYSLKQGIEDGFLAPYRVYRISTRSDRDGWQAAEGELDRYGRTIPTELYQTPDFERKLVRKSRTWAIAQHITDFLKRTNRNAKTIVFCVDEEHVKEMVKALNNLNADITKDNPDYISRITSDAKELGKAKLYDFKDVQNTSHVIAVTSKLLTTGVDVPLCQNVVLARVIRSMTDFKQIIGRGTRVKEEKGKTYFNILDYTNSTVLFDDKEFDGEPDLIQESEIDDKGQTIPSSEHTQDFEQDEEDPNYGWHGLPSEEDDELPRKFYVDGDTEEIVDERRYDLTEDQQLQLSRLVDFTREEVRTLYRSSVEIQQRWVDPGQRSEILDLLAERGINFEDLKEVAGLPDVDPLDLLCHIAFDEPALTYRQRAEKLKRRSPDIFTRYGEDARVILETLLDKYAEHGVSELDVPTTFKVNFPGYNLQEIADKFGGVERLQAAMLQLQNLLYSA